MNPTIIYTKLVGDLFHPGHVEFLKNARMLGDRLVVHVVADERVTVAKRQPIMTQAERLIVVGACRYVDEVCSKGPKVITRAFMEHHNYSLYVFAAANTEEAQIKWRECHDLPKEYVRELPYTGGISTTLLLARAWARKHES